jgi:hypothetical protein
MDIARSVNKVPIRLTDERWAHIVNHHDEIAGYEDDVLHAIEDPDLVLKGDRGSLRAVKSYGRKRYLVVTYREISRTDGFVITAYFVRKIDRKRAVWRR